MLRAVEPRSPRRDRRQPSPLPARGVAAMISYSTAVSRIAASTVSVLLIDVTPSLPSRTFPSRYRSTSSTVIWSSRRVANTGSRWFASTQFIE